MGDIDGRDIQIFMSQRNNLGTRRGAGGMQNKSDIARRGVLDWSIGDRTTSSESQLEEPRFAHFLAVQFHNLNIH